MTSFGSIAGCKTLLPKPYAQNLYACEDSDEDEGCGSYVKLNRMGLQGVNLNDFTSVNPLPFNARLPPPLRNTTRLAVLFWWQRRIVSSESQLRY